MLFRHSPASIDPREPMEYDNVDDAIADYMEIAIQFGFLACFGASFATAGVPRRCF
jgi:hypothetical protein